MAEGQFIVAIEEGNDKLKNNDSIIPGNNEPKGPAGAAVTAGERNGAILMEEFRAALRSPSLLASFISQGADVSVQVWRKALLWACASGHVEFVSQFMNSSPFQSLVHTARDLDDYTPLHRAVLGGHLEIARLLSRIAYYPFLVLHARTKKKGWTALHFAVCANDLQMVDLLLKWYETIDRPSSRLWDFRDNMWMSPLQYGVIGGYHKIVSRILRSEAFQDYVNAVDYFRRTALHMACGHGAGVVVEELLANKFVDPNSVDCCSYTPLHWAVHSGAADAVRCFTSQAMERTIRTTEEDREGRPVLQIAIEYRDIDHKVGRDIQKLLLMVPEVKDEVERLYRDRQVFVDAANAILVGAALIASVTFGGWLQPPQGSDSEIRIFWAFNSLSFFFSLATVLAGAGTVLPLSDVYIGNTVRSIRRWLSLTSFLLLISVVLVLGAFAAAGFSSLPTIPQINQNMTTTVTVGTIVCGIIGLLFLNRMSKMHGLQDLVMQFRAFLARVRSRRRRSMVEVNAELDESRARVIDSAGADFPRSRIDGSYHLANVVLSFENACEKEAMITRQVISDKALEVKKRMKVFEQAFQEVRSGLNEEEGTLNMLTLTELSQNGLHFWMDFSSSHCRQRALEKDLDLWADVKTVVLRDKRMKLEEENTNFYYTTPDRSIHLAPAFPVLLVTVWLWFAILANSFLKVKSTLLRSRPFWTTRLHPPTGTQWIKRRSRIAILPGTLTGSGKKWTERRSPKLPIR
ncbi:hypothetical protein R1sor_001626 [Riccia sorocarpa]|uniref:PGG domain-containing protein n=1 Tax=Riccia sorocarpa TaxID=122646 RepID=A0ABD3H0F6_9MARC